MIKRVTTEVFDETFVTLLVKIYPHQNAVAIII